MIILRAAHSSSALVMVAYAYDSKPGDQRWHPNLDVNSDNIIDITDIAIAAYEYGKVDP